MAKIHIISDLNLEFNEWSNPEDEQIPEGCDLLVINGNIATHIKRSMLFVETICHKYPDLPVIYNIGVSEGATEPPGKNSNVNGLTARMQYSDLWPKNLYFPWLKPVTIDIGLEKYDIMCAVGYPQILSNDGWESSYWSKVTYGQTDDHSLFKPPGAAEVYHGWIEKPITVDEINRRHEQEEKIIRDWELNYHSDSGYKILITAMSPINDPRCKGLKYIMYPKIHLYQRLWITAGVKMSGSIVRGARLVSNPGSGAAARQSLVIV